MRCRGFQIRIWLNEHDPPHVHVHKGRDSATILLHWVEGQNPFIRVGKNLKSSDARSALRMVEENRQFLLQEWIRLIES